MSHVSHIVTYVAFCSFPSLLVDYCIDRHIRIKTNMPPGKGKPPSTTQHQQQHDLPDPSLVIEGTRTRRPPKHLQETPAVVKPPSKNIKKNKVSLFYVYTSYPAQLVCQVTKDHKIPAQAAKIAQPPILEVPPPYSTPLDSPTPDL